MGILVIDGNDVYEIDENCVRQKRLPKECGVGEYLKKAQGEKKEDKQAVKQKHR